MGEILDYPRDILRRKYFVPEHVEHQAKLEVQTYIWLVEHYTQPGDIILDPMSGIGTVHFAATMGRHTVGIEISERFYEIQQWNLAKFDDELGLNAGSIIYLGDCRRFLPLTGWPASFGSMESQVQQALAERHQKADIVIFSPPYADLWKTTKKSAFHEEKHINIGYSDDAGNIGNITNYPLYLAAMREVYSLCNRSLKPGGRLITVTKDYVRARQRVYISKDNVACCLDAGFQVEDWHFRYTDPKVFQIGARKERAESGIDLPELDIDYEDVIVLQKVKEV